MNLETLAKINQVLGEKHRIVTMNNGMSSDPARFYIPGAPADLAIPSTTTSNTNPVRVERQWPELFDAEMMEFMTEFRAREAQLIKENLAAHHAQ